MLLLGSHTLVTQRIKGKCRFNKVDEHNFFGVYWPCLLIMFVLCTFSRTCSCSIEPAEYPRAQGAYREGNWKLTFNEWCSGYYTFDTSIMEQVITNVDYIWEKATSALRHTWLVSISEYTWASITLSLSALTRYQMMYTIPSAFVYTSNFPFLEIWSVSRVSSSPITYY